MQTPTNGTTTPSSVRQQSTEDLFELVRQLPTDEREAAIDAASSDPWVRAEVLSLLGFDGGTVVTRGERRERRFDAESCIGLSFGGFTLQEVIGVGGMGTVFAAEQESPARAIAVKVLHSAIARPTTLARFRKESEFLAKLDHPNIARVIAAGTLSMPRDGRARPYFAMELVEGGRSITRWARETHASREAIVRAFATACDAVGSGHRRGIAHLDLKPGNVLVSLSGDIKVIDYGIARSVTRTREDEKSRATTTATADRDASIDAGFAGTPQYMSPEQFARDDAVVDSRADVYALGMILYELLTHRLPYDTRGMTLSESTELARHTAPTPLRRLDSTLPRDLEAITLKSLAKNPHARYGSASELGDDLRRWLADEPVVAGPPRAVDAALRLVRRNPLLAFFSVTTVLAVAVGVVVSAWYARQTADAETRLFYNTAVYDLKVADLAGDNQATVDTHLRKVPDTMQQWEWRHLRTRGPSTEIFARTPSESLSVAASDDSNEVIAGVTGGDLLIADCARIRAPERRDLRSFFDAPISAHFLSVAPADSGRTVLLCTGEGKLLSLHRDTNTAYTLLASGARCAIVSGSLIAVGRNDGTACLVDSVAGGVIAECPPSTPTDDVCLAKQGRAALFSLTDGRLRYIDIDPDARTVRERWLTTPRDTTSRAAAISPDGSITRHDSKTGATLATKDLSGGTVYDLAISPDNHTVAVSSWARTIRVVDATTLKVVNKLAGTDAPVWGIDFTRDGTRLVGRMTPRLARHGGAPAHEDYIGAWNFDEPAPATVTRDLHATLRTATHGPTPGLFTAVTSANDLIEFDAGAPNDAPRVHTTLSESASMVTRSNGWIIVGSTAGSVEALRFEEGATQVTSAWRVNVHPNAISGLAISPDERSIAVGDDRNHVAMLDLSNGAQRWRADIPPQHHRSWRGGVRQPIFLDDGASIFFATCLPEAPYQIYHTMSGNLGNSRSLGSNGTLEWESGVLRKSDGRVYLIGVVGYMAALGDGAMHDFKEVAQNGGMLCSDKEQTRLFVATRDSSVCVTAFEPLDALLRLDAPPGDPLAIGFDDGRDELSVLTKRGLLRTWNTLAKPRFIPPELSETITPTKHGELPTNAAPRAANQR